MATIYKSSFKVGDLYFFKEKIIVDGEMKDVIKLLTIVDIMVKTSDKNPNFSAFFIKTLDVEKERLYESDTSQINKNQKLMTMYLEEYSNLDLGDKQKEDYINTLNFDISKLEGKRDICVFIKRGVWIFAKSDVEYESGLIACNFERSYLMSIAKKIQADRFDTNRRLRYNEDENFYYFS